ncbi:hypothetical protein DFJ67_1146 [Asanoa ferruginea]|uniref:Uncharacterized protein n=1 Tax=Asanoa ferruginea TaxID=53367 RepID=A0A3D9ZFA2_9ACTN|nr:hypothetical protein [Asanoa ferruginea]REF95194.1 hypothetical protein DFJ67_1146 [Asanoa ferruginea]GIF52820.1 hypothetical protein Afe04nite_73590 [Asanoa ferruginea]
MSGDPGLEGRLRSALTRAADAVDPPVAELLPRATARGRRRRRLQRAALLTAVLAALASVGVLVLPAGRQTPATLSSDALTGSWETRSLPATDWAASYRRAGGSDAAARAFLGPPMGGPAQEHRIILRITTTQWASFVRADSAAPEPGFQGTYTIEESTVRVREASHQCDVVFDIAASTTTLRIHVVDDDCGESDLLAQRTIYETADFHRST